MTLLLSVFVPGLPIAQPRVKARALVTAGRAFARVYTPSAKVGPWRERIALYGKQAREAGKYAEQGTPVRLTLRAIFPRPKARQWKRKPQPAEWMVGRPDLDNIEKAIKDALKGVVWHDDDQVCSVAAEKIIAAGNQPIGLYLHVETIETGPA